MSKIYLLLLSVILLNTVTAQTPVLYKDINSLVNLGSISGNPEYTKVGNKVFFIATAPATGIELYVSDGTTGGTSVIDINTGAGSSTPTGLTEMNGILYFSASDGIHGRELWKSDGTTPGTKMIKDIDPRELVGSSPLQLINVNGILYFEGKDGITGAELWKSDGTEAGTVLVKNINPGFASPGISNMTGIGNTIYFSANDGTNGAELWKSDGTEEGTVLIDEIMQNSRKVF